MNNSKHGRNPVGTDSCFIFTLVVWVLPKGAWGGAGRGAGCGPAAHCSKARKQARLVSVKTILNLSQRINLSSCLEKSFKKKKKKIGEWGWVGGIYVYLWLIHIDIWQKPTQYCKTTILRLEINKFKTFLEKSLYFNVGCIVLPGSSPQFNPYPSTLFLMFSPIHDFVSRKIYFPFLPTRHFPSWSALALFHLTWINFFIHPWFSV